MTIIAFIKNKIIIDKSSLPMKTEKTIDWERAVNCTVPFQCNDIHGELLIKDFASDDHKKFLVEFNGRTKIINRHCILYGTFVDLVINAELRLSHNLGDIVEICHFPYKVKIVNYGVRTTYGKECVFYECLCPNCKNTFCLEQKYFQSYSCPHCTKTRNNLTKTAPWMIKYFQGGYEEAKKYNKSSRKKIFPVCPDCGRIQKTPVQIKSLYVNGIACSCSSNISFPEKFIISLLDQLSVEYIYQPTLEHLGFAQSLKRYDFYIPSLSMIIETNGIQHYENIKDWNKAELQTVNDQYKKDLALNHGIQHYIELDCRYSTISHIKKSVMNSVLPKMLDFSESDIDWKLCVHYKKTRLAKMICRDYSEKYMSKSELCEKYGLSNTAINKALQTGNRYGWCVHSFSVNTGYKPIEITKDGNHIAYFRSIADAENKSKKMFGFTMHDRFIKEVMDGKRSHYKGFSFRHVDDIPLRWKILQKQVS